jgi:tRNA pseudouridine38-40 synthase
MRILKLTLAYDGTRFVGWQRQADGESIQQLLEDALARFEGAPVTVHGAGRTDAGVHALGQVASASVTFTHPAATIVRALNAQLPEDVRILDVVDAASGFHARFSARSKSYRYCIRAGAVGDPFTRAFAWQLPEPLNVTAMTDAAAALVGTHDFAAFQSAGTEVASTVRTIFRSEFRGPEGSAPLPSIPQSGAELSGPRQHLVYEVMADGFLRHMVRAIVGTLVEIGRGWRSVESMAELIDHGARAEAGATAPPHGLFLVRVDYD